MGRPRHTGPVAGDRLPGRDEIIDCNELDGKIEHAMINFVGVPAEALPSIRKMPVRGNAVLLSPTWVLQLREIDARGYDIIGFAKTAVPTHLIPGTATTGFLAQLVHALAQVTTDAVGADHSAQLPVHGDLALSVWDGIAAPTVG
ncbi:hypothetical protein BANT10_02605 [Brevibacterium antiquum]|nr:hypothetical protein BANT918_01025 [Brevibacterium antiquum CNRZ 918]SMX93719.1 hypothetical protein BANT10_02605 [Brevibacterium antiquum]